jgi:SAM domain (Sterile alpha motif)
MKGIAEWLASIGLSEYAQRFAENAIDLSVVRDLTEQDLKDLGVLLGHRRKMLRAIAELDPGALTPAETATESVPRDEGERRHLTVMFCDLVGSTALSARLDPEEMWPVMASYHACIGEVIGRYEGMIARYRRARTCRCRGESPDKCRRRTTGSHWDCDRHCYRERASH